MNQKEYGREANHILERIENRVPVASQNPRALSQAGAKRKFNESDHEQQQKRPKFAAPPPVARGYQPSARPFSAAPKPSKVEDEVLHPSWIAKRKQKEIMANLDSFQGKKVVFDD